LLDRKTGRDLFDAHHLLTKTNLDMPKLRLALIIYSGISRKVDLRQLTPQVISVDIKDLNNRLLPLLRKSEISSMYRVSNWANLLIEECQKAFSHFLPLTDNEQAFLHQLLDNGMIKPELISDDLALINNIKIHPGVKWSAQQSNKK
jgi:hypothetical protein